MGGNRGVVKSFVVQADSVLDIDFARVVENPSIAAIEILPASLTRDIGQRGGKWNCVDTRLVFRQRFVAIRFFKTRWPLSREQPRCRTPSISRIRRYRRELPVDFPDRTLGPEYRCRDAVGFPSRSGNYEVRSTSPRLTTPLLAASVFSMFPLRMH